MKKTKLLLISLWLLLLAWCTSIQNTATEEPITDTWDIETIEAETGMEIEITTEDIEETENNIIIDEDENTDNEEINDVSTTSNQATAEITEEENDLKEKIRQLIEDRKVETKWSDELTEDDIVLMENILKQIVDSTSQ